MIKYKKLNPFNSFGLYRFLKNNKDEFFTPHKFDYLTILKNCFNKDIYIIQLIDKKIVGYGMLRGWEEGYEIPILGIIIDKNYRGMGLSKDLMNFLHNIARTKGSIKVMLKVYKNNIVAINLYKKCNYEFTDYNNELLVGYKTI